MNPRIKICGLTRRKDIVLCEELGVDYIGLNFVPSSSRCLTVDQAQILCNEVASMNVVGVFADQPIDEVLQIASDVPLDILQFHGNEDLEELRTLDLPVIKAFRSVPPLDLLEAYLSAGIALMLDGSANGEQADLKSIEALPEGLRSQIFLAGGLNGENVADAIDRIHPFAVDVASGIERSPGIKDLELLKQFVSYVRSTS